MPLQSSGNPISLGDIQTEFGGASPTSISEYYKGGTYVPNTATNSGVPTSGTISLGDFYGASAAGTTPTYSVTAPASINEGSSDTISVTTTNVANGTTLYWTVTPSGDFATASGSFSINSNAGFFTVTPTADSTTEGPETGTIQIRTGSTSGTIVASDTFTINDTSQNVDNTPNSFGFINTTPNQTLRSSTIYSSNTETISGLGTGVAATLSISGGEYSKNGGGYTSSTGTIQNGDTLRVRTTSSGSSGGVVNVYTTVGTLTDVWVVTSYYDLAGTFNVADMSGTSTYTNWDGESTNSQEQTTVSTSSDSVNMGGTGYGTYSYRWEFVTSSNTGASLVYISGGFANKFSASTNIVATYKLATGQSGSSLTGNIQGTYKCVVTDSLGNSVDVIYGSGGAFTGFYIATYKFQT